MITEKKSMNILVVGLGFVGLSTALVLCEQKAIRSVWGIDKNGFLYRQNKAPFYEPVLDEKLAEYRDSRFFVVDSYERLKGKGMDAVYFCVGTPQNDSGSCDFTSLKEAICECVEGLGKDSFRTYIIKSSVPPGSMDNVIEPLFSSLYCGHEKNYDLAYNPEFLRESHAWEDSRYPDRIVVGTNSEHAREVLCSIYSEQKEAPLVVVSPATAEFIKYLSNAFLATVISFSNDMTMLAEHIGRIDVSTAFKTIHLDKRWYGAPCQMTSYLYPGCGFGGYCLPKDINALYHSGKENGYDSSLLKSVVEVNRAARRNIVKRISETCRKDDSIGILGLSFKPGSDDVRESPARDIIESLLSAGYSDLKAYDPMAMDHFARTYPFDIQYCGSLDKIVEECNVLVLVTAWPEFIASEAMLKTRKVIDGRYCLS